jgi:hypothetical protein
MLYEDDDEICGCSGGDFAVGPTSDDDIPIVVLSGSASTVEEIEERMHQYKELFPNG